MQQPGKLGELVACLWLNEPPESFAILTNRLAPAHLKSVLAETKEALTMSMSPIDLARRSLDPFDLLDLPGLTNLPGLSFEQGQKMFTSGEGNFRLVFVEAAVDLTSYRSCESWLEAIRSTIAGLRAQGPKGDWDGVVVRYTGRPVFVTEVASGMQRDLGGSVIGTSFIIALLFWLTHRRWLPMFWLLTLLGLILFATLALGGLLLGTIGVVSLGFAAVLLGLAVDYAVVHYQEALAHPQFTVPEIRRAIAPSILWAALTTISAFLVLNLGGLPGLAQLGTLVALGIALAAWVMVMIYLPPLFPDRRRAPPHLGPAKWWTFFIPPQQADSASSGARPPDVARPLAVTALVLIFAAAVISVRRPGLDRTGNALRPAHSEAESALAEMSAEMGLPPDPIWLIVTGKSENEVHRRLSASEQLLNTAAASQLIAGYLLPTALWPRAECQAANQPMAALLSSEGPLLRQSALDEGFNTNALALTDEAVRTWTRATASSSVVWPTNEVSRSLLNRFAARTPRELLAMGLVYPSTNHVSTASLLPLSSVLAKDQAWLSSWDLLGTATLNRVRGRLWQVVLPMIVLVLASLWSAFRRPAEICLGLAVLCLSGLCLLATMAMAGWSWNLLNLMALPLVLGTGVDYTIFIQLGLRRHGGDLALVRRSIGRALLLCGGTAMSGFGSLGWSSNLGMASLGRVCAVGIGANVLISIFLLPAWWTLVLGQKGREGEQRTEEGERRAESGETAVRGPSSFYHAGLWRIGLAIVRILPAALLKGVSVCVAEVYYLLRRKRRELVLQNLLPALGGNRAGAQRAVHRLHRNFALKLVDLWLVESGLPVQEWLTEPSGLERIRAAHARGNGVLFITLHLGNWEHGGLLLSQVGIPLTVLTLAEPDGGLTDLRISSRRRYGVETLVIGQDDFAFVEVIKRLQAGAALAIAMDRPPARGAVPVHFFGSDFEAPAAAAELARASGCALLGVTILRRRQGYAVKVLPEFAYDRKSLSSREARRALTEQILRAFEPEIRNDIDQWYQFVPIWPKQG
jgi:predicted exporter/lauroyl/myristoyl acyltransferase